MNSSSLIISEDIFKIEEIFKIALFLQYLFSKLQKLLHPGLILHRILLDYNHLFLK